MANEDKNLKLSTEPKAPEASGIVSQGEPFKAVTGGSRPSKAPAGRYVVKHGEVTGFLDAAGERVRAFPGAVLTLTSEDATALVAAGTVEQERA